MANILLDDAVPVAGKQLYKRLVMKYGSITEAARKLGKSRETIYKHIHQGSYPEWVK